jgi:hypothetical protein
MKAITIKQPWAQLIAEGAKDIENRDWWTRERGRIAIHSSAKIAASDIEDACTAMRTFIPRFSSRIFTAEAVTYPAGSIIAVADLVGCVSESESPWFFGRFGFLFRGAIKLPEPIRIRGALGFWEVPPDVQRQIDQQLKMSADLTKPEAIK